jgi:hypothetical protein
MARYGQKDGDGPTAGKVASVYQITLPDGRVFKKRKFDVHTERAIATADEHNGKVIVAVWSGEPAWEGDFGRLEAIRISEGHSFAYHPSLHRGHASA